MAPNTTTYRRATDFIEGIGDSIDTLQGRDVLVRSVEVSNRPMRGESAVFVSMEISELDAPEEVKRYHAWSDSLAEKLQQIPEANFPVLCKFGKVRTGSGYNVWTVQ